MSRRLSESPFALAAAGVGAVGLGFGMARYGYGLLVPDIRREFGISSATLGLLAAASYLSYLVTCMGAGVLTQRLGPRAIVVAGGASAVAGMAIAGVAHSVPVLFAGLLVAGASAGLVFPPFADVVAARVRPALRSRVLATVSAGTGWGVAVAGPIALAVGTQWRTAWLLFAAVGVVVTIAAAVVLPGREEAPVGGGARISPRWFVCPRSTPLLGAILLVGLASSAYWVFAVDRLAGAGGLSAAQPKIFLVVVGVASISGSMSGDLVRKLGGAATFAVALLAEGAALLLIGLVPGSFATALLSAVLFGWSYNVVVAVGVIWSAKVYETRPAAGLAATESMNGVGALIGPPLLGALADAEGGATLFVAAAVLALLALPLYPRERIEPVPSVTRAC